MFAVDNSLYLITLLGMSCSLQFRYCRQDGNSSQNWHCRQDGNSSQNWHHCRGCRRHWILYKKNSCFVWFSVGCSSCPRLYACATDTNSIIIISIIIIIWSRLRNYMSHCSSSWNVANAGHFFSFFLVFTLVEIDQSSSDFLNEWNPPLMNLFYSRRVVFFSSLTNRSSADQHPCR